MGAQNTPAAEVDVTPDLVRSLLLVERPDLADRDITLFAHGWDNISYRLGPDLLVRLPRRALAAPLIDHEIRWLPELAPALPVPVPVPLHAGSPSGRYPWRWSVVPLFEGRAVGADPLAGPAGLARDLGRFLAALHRPAPPDAPANPYRGVPLAERAEITGRRLGVLDADPALVARVEAAWSRALEAPPWTGPPIWLHGDLHPANIIVHRRRLAAVVDFGDLTAGDPATDLLGAWAMFDAGGRATLRSAADTPDRRIDDAMWTRARGWAVAHALAVVASSADNPAMHAMGMRSLRAIAAE